MTCQICAKANCIGECEPKIKPTVPDAIHHTDLGETLEYIQGWNDCRQAMLAEQPAQPHAWFTVDELNAWADKKLKENPQWAEQPAQQEPSDLDVWKARALQAEAVIEKFMAEQPAQQAPVPWSQALEDVWAEPGEVFPPAQQEPVLQDIEQYRLQMAGISTAAIGYWKESDGIHPDYDTIALRDVAKLYAKYDELYRAQRTWVGLLWGNLPEDGQNHDFLRGAVWAEAKLKELNT